MKKFNLLSALTLATTVISFSANAEVDTELAKIKREVGIMEKILSASLAQDTNKRVRNVSASYLKNQGVVFSLDIRGSSRWQTIFASVPEAPLPPMPDIDFDSIDVEFINDHIQVISDEVVVQSKEAYQQAMEVMRESAERIRMNAEHEREVSREIRDLEREKRDIDFASQHDNKAEEKQLAERKKQLEKSIKELEKQQQTLTEKQQKLRKELADKKQARKQQQEQDLNQLVAQVNRSISLSLCDYGSGLRSLGNNEHVSFVIRGASNDNSELVKVFTKKAIKQCIVGDIDAKQLANSAQSYQF